MKKLFVLLAAILLFCCACGDVPDDARGRLFMYTRADEDEYGVYWVSRGYSSDEPEPFCAKGLYYYNKATGETYHYSENFDFLALHDGILYFCTSKLQGDREIFIIPAETFRAAPKDWRKNAKRVVNLTFSSTLDIWGDRFCFLSGGYLGEVTSTDANLENPEYFIEINRVVCGYENGKYYTLDVEPNNDGTVKLTLCRDGDALFVLHERWSGLITRGDCCAIYNGYVYYYEENRMLRRRLSRWSKVEELWSGFDLRYTYHRWQSVTGVEDGHITEILSYPCVYTNSNNDLIAVAADGVYVRDENDRVLCVALDGSESKQVQLNFDGGNVFFISSLDNRLKYVNPDGVFLVE